MDKRGLGKKEELIVGIENGEEKELGNVEKLEKKVDEEKKVEREKKKVENDLDEIKSVDIRVNIEKEKELLVKILGKVLRNEFGKKGEESEIEIIRSIEDLEKKIVKMSIGRKDLERRVDEEGREDEML